MTRAQIVRRVSRLIQNREELDGRASRAIRRHAIATIRSGRSIAWALSEIARMARRHHAV